jgi:hypothetical protein
MAAWRNVFAEKRDEKCCHFEDQQQINKKLLIPEIASQKTPAQAG